MKIIQFVFHVTVLMLMLLGIGLIGVYIGYDDDFHGKVPFDPSRHPLVSGVVILYWVLLPFVTRFSMVEFLTTAFIAQLVVIAFVTFRVYCGGDIHDSGWLFRGWLTWIWIYAKLLTLPFAVTITSSAVIKEIIQRGQQTSAGDGVKSAAPEK